MTRIQLRRDTAAQWALENPVLAEGEEGYETDTGRSKIGNGEDQWLDLPYSIDKNVVSLRDHIISTSVVSGSTIHVFDASAVVAAMESGNGVCYIPPGMWQPNAYNIPLDDTLLPDVTAKDTFVYVFRGAGRQSYLIGVNGMTTGDYLFKANSTDDANSYMSHPKIVCEDFTFKGARGAAGSATASFLRAYQRSVHARRINLVAYHEGFRLTGYADSCRFEHINSNYGQTTTGWMIISDDRGDGHVYDNIFAYCANAVSLRGQVGANLRGCVGGRYSFTFSDVTMQDCHIEGFPSAESDATRFLPVISIRSSSVRLASGSYFPVGYRKFISVNDAGDSRAHTRLVIDDAVRWVQRLDAPGSTVGAVRGSCIDIVDIGHTGSITSHRSSMFFYANVAGHAGESHTRLAGPYITVSGVTSELTALATYLGYSNMIAGLGGDFEIRWEAGEWLPRPISRAIPLRAPTGGTTLTAAAYNGTYGVVWGSDMVTGTTYYYRIWIIDSGGLRSSAAAEVSAATDADNNVIKLTVDTRFAPCALRVVRGTSAGTYTHYVTIPMAVANASLVDQGSAINGYAWNDATGYPSLVTPPTASEMVHGMFYTNNYLKLFWSQAAGTIPTYGTHSRGDVCFDVQPTAGYPAGWICTAAGTPGTWVPFGQIGGPLITTLTGSATLSAQAGCEYIYLLGSGAVPTLPTAVGNTSKYTIKNTHTAAINLATTSSQTIEGLAAPFSIEAGASVTLVSTGTNWVVI